LDDRRFDYDGTFTYFNDSSHVKPYIFVIDSGIRSTHNEFNGRVLDGLDFINETKLGKHDCNGHGTHVAALAAGNSVGVARNAFIVPIRVFGCDIGTASIIDIMSGIEWVITNRTSYRPAVIVMSLSAPQYSPLKDAVENAISSGIVVVASAGNSAKDACLRYPAGIGPVITVGATENVPSGTGSYYDSKTYFTNIGTCVDIFAPGESIYSAAHVADNMYTYKTGTSMSAPYMAGVIAS
jgi:subtilisin family serine protease